MSSPSDVGLKILSSRNPAKKATRPKKNTGNSQNETTEDHFNPFPEGYGEDLIDENYD